jgi:hypothetical protein
VRHAGGGVAYRTIQLTEHAGRIAERPPAGEQFVSHHAEREDVAGDAGALAANLLGAGIAGRQHAGACQGGIPIGIEQAGSAEIQQLHRSLGVHQDIGRFEIAVHDQVAVGVVDGVADLQQEFQPGGDRQTAAVAEAVDSLPFDQLGNEERVAGRGYPAVHQARDMRVAQRRQDLPLRLKAAQELGTGQVC